VPALSLSVPGERPLAGARPEALRSSGRTALRQSWLDSDKCPASSPTPRRNRRSLCGRHTLSPRCSHLRRVFIHEDGCPRYEPAAGFPPALREGRLTFNAYGADRALVARERTESAAEVDGAIDRLLAVDGVDYVHVRSTSAGCFLCRLDRAA
jgi:hypothetical protein